MLPQLFKSTGNALLKVRSNTGDLSTDINLNYNKSTFDRENDVTTINVDRAVQGKGDVANTKTYVQNTVKKYELTGNKEVCIRKIFVAERTDSLFDITVRELKLYYRKNKKHQFNKVIRFKAASGAIEHIFEILKNQATQKNLSVQTGYLLN